MECRKIKDLSGPERIKIQRAQTCYGFLTLGWKPEYYYFEILIMIRNAAIIITTDFTNTLSRDA